MRRLALYPFALIYGAVIWLRNRCFDLHLFKSQPISGKSICIGNISVGGTGKSPHVAYLIAQLHAQVELQVLSRGYGRKTSGFILLDATKTPQEVGDEPCMLYAQHHNKAQFAVCENRNYGIQRLRSAKPSSLILLDDAFQHRYVKPGLQLLLTPFHEQFLNDWHLPSGNLRESKAGAHRADAIILTKCPNLTKKEMEVHRKRYETYQKPIFFSSIEYAELQLVGTPIPQIKSILLVTPSSIRASPMIRLIHIS